jgi:hypothetical protein
MPVAVTPPALAITTRRAIGPSFTPAVFPCRSSHSLELAKYLVTWRRTFAAGATYPRATPWATFGTTRRAGMMSADKVRQLGKFGTAELVVAVGVEPVE